MRPAEWRRRTSRPAEKQASLGDVGRIPDLFGKHEPLAGETFERADKLGRRQSHRKKVASSFAGQNGPWPSNAAAVPRRSILMLAVSITDVTTPAGAGGQ